MSLLANEPQSKGVKVQITNGGIYRVRDSAIDFPADDKKKTRTEHDFRTVVVLSSQDHCDNAEEEDILVAPMSHEMGLKHATDCEVRPSKENGLDKPGRIMLGHIQPITKAALEKKFGRFSDWEWNVICAHVLSNIDR